MNYKAYYSDGLLNEKKNLWDDAATCYQKAIACVPNCYGLTQWAQSYLLFGAKPPEIRPDQLANIYLALGRCFHNLSQPVNCRLVLEAADNLIQKRFAQASAASANQLLNDTLFTTVKPAVHKPELYKPKLTIVFFTHYTDKLHHNSHLSPPGTGLLETTYDTLLYNVDPELSCCKKILCYDQNASHQPPEKHYRQNLNLFAERHQFTIMTGQNAGLRRLLVDALKIITTPYMMFIEHDWRFLGPPVNIGRLLRVFDAFAQINSVRLNQRSNQICRFDFLLEEEDLIPFPALLKTVPYSNNPNIVRTSTMINEWLPICFNDPVYGYGPLNGTAFGIEEPLFRQHINDIREVGFKKAHKKWGTYILGKHADPARIEHLGH